jgi:hypothetical protein
MLVAAILIVAAGCSLASPAPDVRFDHPLDRVKYAFLIREADLARARRDLDLHIAGAPSEAAIIARLAVIDVTCRPPGGTPLHCNYVAVGSSNPMLSPVRNFRFDYSIEVAPGLQRDRVIRLCISSILTNPDPDESPPRPMVACDPQ